MTDPLKSLRDAVRESEGQMRAAAPRLRALSSLLTDHRRELDERAREEIAEELRGTAARLDTARRVMVARADEAEEITRPLPIPPLGMLDRR